MFKQIHLLYLLWAHIIPATESSSFAQPIVANLCKSLVGNCVGHSGFSFEIKTNMIFQFVNLMVFPFSHLSAGISIWFHTPFSDTLRKITQNCRCFSHQTRLKIRCSISAFDSQRETHWYFYYISSLLNPIMLVKQETAIHVNWCVIAPIKIVRLEMVDPIALRTSYG